MLLLFLISVDTASGTFPLTPPHQQRGWGYTGIRKGHRQASWPQWLKWNLIPHGPILSMQNQVEGGRGKVCRDGVCLITVIHEPGSWLNTFLLMRRDEWILFRSACMCNFCFISISSHKYSQISNSVSYCTRGEWVVAWYSDTGWG